MRIRSIKPEFWEDETLAALPPHDRLLFIACWQLADRNGILERRDAWIKAKVFPYETGETTDVSRMIPRLVSGKFLSEYHVSGKTYLRVRNFSRHQRITGKEALSKGYHPLPEKVAERETPGKHPGNNGATTEIVREQGAGSREQGAMPGGPGRVLSPSPVPDSDPNLFPSATRQDAPGCSDTPTTTIQAPPPPVSGRGEAPSHQGDDSANRVTPRQEPIGTALPKVAALHALYQTLTGQTAVRLDMAAERRWAEFIRAGWGEPELRRVVAHIQAGIKRRERNSGALRLSNLIDPERFNEELGMATASPKPKPRPPEPERPAVAMATPEQLASFAARAKVLREKFTGHSEPEKPAPAEKPNLPTAVAAEVAAAVERNKHKVTM